MDSLEKKEINKFIVFIFITLAFGIVSTFTYAVYNILTHHSMLTIVSSIILFIIEGLILIAGYNVEDKKARIIMSIISIIISIFTIIVMVVDIAKPKYKVIDFT